MKLAFKKIAIVFAFVTLVFMMLSVMGINPSDLSPWVPFWLAVGTYIVVHLYFKHRVLKDDPIEKKS